MVTPLNSAAESLLGGCQNYGPFLGTLNNSCRIIIGTQKGTIILTTTLFKRGLQSRLSVSAIQHCRVLVRAHTVETGTPVSSSSRLSSNRNQPDMTPSVCLSPRTKAYIEKFPDRSTELGFTAPRAHLEATNNEREVQAWIPAPNPQPLTPPPRKTASQ